MREEDRKAIEFKHEYSPHLTRLLALYRKDGGGSEIAQALEFMFLLRKVTKGDHVEIVILARISPRCNHQ